MAPILLDDEGIERFETLAAAPALELLEALPADQGPAVRAHILEERSYTRRSRWRCTSPRRRRKRVSRGSGR